MEVVGLVCFFVGCFSVSEGRLSVSFKPKESNKKHYLQVHNQNEKANISELSRGN